MNITEEILKDLGAKLIDNKKRVWELNSFYRLHWQERNEFGGEIFDVWEMRAHDQLAFHGHTVDSLEEIISFAYKDGWCDGRNSLKKDFNDLLKED